MINLLWLVSLQSTILNEITRLSLDLDHLYWTGLRQLNNKINQYLLHQVNQVLYIDKRVNRKKTRQNFPDSPTLSDNN